ncbi:hypothetical protein HRbin36_02604 [bacterium HR36]|nr:hypothetical protein HRbin36_02604 [bacterium HR36]
MAQSVVQIVVAPGASKAQDVTRYSLPLIMAHHPWAFHGQGSSETTMEGPGILWGAAQNFQGSCFVDGSTQQFLIGSQKPMGKPRSKGTGLRCSGMVQRNGCKGLLELLS